jgi:gliding motility-associated-like protein
MSNEDVDQGDTVRVEVTVDDFTGIAGIQYSHNFDSTVLEYVDVVDKAAQLPGLSNTGPEGATVDNGEIVITWNDPSGGTTDLNNGTLIYAIRFVAIGNECDSSVINITNTPRRIEILDDNLDNIGLDTVSGQVKINGEDCETLPDVSIRLNENSGDTGTEICLEARVNGFEEIESFQWSLTWDQSVATFSRVTGFNLQSLDAGDFNFNGGTQTLNCVWSDDQGQSVSVPNATRIVNICFNLIGNPGSMTDVEFTNSPLPLEFNRDAGTAGSSSVDGKLTINQMGGNDPTILDLGEITGNCNEDICVPIIVTDFNDVGSMQFSVNYPAGLTFTGSRGHALPVFGAGDVANPRAGEITVVWTDAGGGGQSLPDGSTLVELCFQSATGDVNYDITFSNNPLRLELTDSDGIEIMTNTMDGRVTVRPCGGDNVMVSLVDTFRQACSDRCNGFIDISVSGGSGQYTYMWFLDGSPFPQTVQDPRNLCAGTYRVIVCDANDATNCDTLDNIIVTKPDPLTVMANVTGDLGNCTGSIALTVNGGTPQYSYRWSDNQNTPTAVNLCKGDYNCTITDSRNCVLISDTFTVTGPPIIIDNVDVIMPQCHGDCDGSIDITVSGGCGPLSFEWTGQDVDADAEDQSGLCAGEYKVVVTDTSGGMAMQTITITEPDPIVIRLDSIQNGQPGSIFVTISGGTVSGDYILKWTDLGGVLVSQDEDPMNLDTGRYIIMVTDDNDCVAMDTFTISDRELEIDIDLSLTSGGTNVSCNGECDATAMAMVTGGSGNYSYEWSHDPTETGAMVTDLCAGMYTLTVMDLSNGATMVANFTVTEPDELAAMVVEIRCADGVGVANGAYRADVTGGSGPYSYLWCNNSSSSQPINLVGGAACNVLITDVNGCQIFVDGFEICNDGGGEPTDACFEGRDVITPNGDGMNDALTITCLNDPRFSDNELFIFNRRGQLVNQYRNYTDEWRGTDENGNLVTEDAYMWVLNILLPNGQRDIYRGTVTVILN